MIRAIVLGWFACGAVAIAWRQIHVWSVLRKKSSADRERDGERFVFRWWETAVVLLVGPLALGQLIVFVSWSSYHLRSFIRFEKQTTREITALAVAFDQAAVVVHTQACSAGCPRVLTVTLPFRVDPRSAPVFCSRACAERTQEGADPGTEG